MRKPRAKKTVKRTETLPTVNENRKEDAKEPQIECQEPPFVDVEVERQIAAIRAVRDVEIERLLTELHLLQSYLSKEQLQTPVRQFFEETLPNLLVENNKENKEFEVKWNDKDSRLSMSCDAGRDIHTCLLRRLSIAFPDSSAAIPPMGGFEYSSRAGRTSFLAADNLHFRDFGTILLLNKCLLYRSWEEPSETQTLAMQDAFQTPEVSSQRLSVGMTPKTLRQPKPGEMLLSVQDSKGYLLVSTRKITWKPYTSQKRVECLLNLPSGSLWFQNKLDASMCTDHYHFSCF